MENYADDQIEVEFKDFYDFYAHNFSLFENGTNEEKEQENSDDLEFKVSCIVNIASLEGSSKEQAGCIIEIISDIDEYTWM